VAKGVFPKFGFDSVDLLAKCKLLQAGSDCELFFVPQVIVELRTS
jgi:hypothetical protein